MKKKVIKSITLIAIGALLVGVPVGAATYISSRDIEYTTEHNENITNVNEALDDLIGSVDLLKSYGNATSQNILSGKTALVNGNKLIGSMSNYSGSTITSGNISENGDNAIVTVPEGYYNENSKISIPVDTIIKEVPTISSNIGPTPSEGGLPFRIESITMSHNASSDDTRHTYAPVYVTIKWLKSCTISGITYSGSTSQSGGGLSIGEMNGYHAKGSTTTFSGSVDSAYDAGSCGITFNYANANVVCS